MVKVEGPKPGTKRKVGVVLEVVTRREEHDRRIDFYDPFEDEKAKGKILKEGFDSYLDAMILRGFAVVQSRTLPPTDAVPLAIQVVSLRLAEQVRLICSVTHQGAHPFPLEDIRVEGTDERTNHVETIRVESEQPTRDGLLADIAPQESIAVVIKLKEAQGLGRFVTMHFLAASGASRAEQIQIWPPPKYKPPGKQEDRLTLQAQGVVGFVNLTNSANAPTDSDFTTHWGVGGRTLYGFSRSMSIEGSVAVLFTDQAVFEDSSTAKATAARALVGGVLHIGEKTVPYLRAGIGFQLARYTMSTSDEWRSSSLLCIGGGVDAWVGDSIVVGVSASYVGPLNSGDDATSFEVGVHAGIAWSVEDWGE